MKRLPRRGRQAALVLILLALFGALLALRSRVAWDEACTLARRNLPALLGLEVGIGRCEIDPARRLVRLYGLSAFLPGTDEPLLSADLAEARVAVLQPLFGQLELERVEIRRPRVNLDLSGLGAASHRPSSRCPLEALDRVRVNRLAIKGAEVRVRLPGGHRVELAGLDLGWTMRRRVAELELEARQGSWSLGPSRGALSLSRLSLEGGLEPGDGTLEVTRGELGLDDITLSLSGKVEQLCDPGFSLDGQLFLPLRTVARAAGFGEEVKGHLWASLSVSGRGPAPALAFDVAGTDLQVGAYHPGDFKARLTLAGAELTLAELILPAGEGGAIRASGGLTLKGNLPVRLRVDAEQAELGPLLAKAGRPGAWVNLLASGRGTFQGHLLPQLSLIGEGDFRVSHFVLAAHPYDEPASGARPILTFDQGRMAGGVRIHPDRWELSGVQLSSGGSHASVSGVLYHDEARGLALKGRFEALDLSDFGRIGALPWKGTGWAVFEAAGPYRAMKVDSTIAMRDFDLWDFSLGALQGKALYADGVLRFPLLTAQKGRTGYTGSVELDFSGPQLHARADVDVPRGRAEDLIDAIVRLHSSLELFQETLDGDARGRVRLDSLGGRLAGEVELALSRMRYYGRRLGDGQMVLTFSREPGGSSFFNGESLEVKEFHLAGPIGELSVQGRWSFDGPLDFRLRGGRLSLAEVVGPERAQRLGISGTLSLDGRVEGDSTTPVTNLSLTSPRITFVDRSLGEMLLNGRIVGREMQIWGKPFADAYAAVGLTLRGQVPYEGTVTLKLPELRPLLPAGAISQGVSGVLEGTIDAEGEARDPAGSRATATFQRLSLSRADFTAENDGDIVLAYANRRLDLQSFTLRGPNTRLAASGWTDARSMDVKLRGALDMRLLESFLPVLDRTGGQVELDATARGALEEPSLVGSAKVRDVGFSVKDRPIALRGLSGEVAFSEAGIVVRGLEGLLNDGRVSLRGDVGLEHFSLKQVRLDAQLEEVAFRPAEDLPLTASGQLLLYGKADALILSGNLDVVRLRYERPLELETLLRSAGEVRATLASAAARTHDWLRFDVGVRLGDVRVENNLARARLLGELKLTGTNARPGLLGTVETGPGSQAFFRGNRFTITQCLIEFKDETSIDPTFDLRAETQVREYLLRLHASGRPSAPKLVLTSEPGLPESDVISLLTLGVISSDHNNTTAAGAGLATEALLNVAGLDREVERLQHFLPRNKVLRDLSFHISTTYNEASGLVEPAAQLESKFLTEQLKLSMTRPVSGRGTRAQAEYRFNNELSAQAQWDNDQSETSSFGNLGVDLKLRWEVE